MIRTNTVFFCFFLNHTDVLQSRKMHKFLTDVQFDIKVLCPPPPPPLPVCLSHTLRPTPGGRYELEKEVLWIHSHHSLCCLIPMSNCFLHSTGSCPLKAPPSWPLLGLLGMWGLQHWEGGGWTAGQLCRFKTTTLLLLTFSLLSVFVTWGGGLKYLLYTYTSKMF